ncbi:MULTISPECIES: GIY-YIG nuclease family protein [unclassified Sphingomonas]|uniref:GIY-YIG nuclease family protein n=1 Tax=unclassified Sphingomonas TaxID=196159 RepID=UPI000701959A|nr:MULTISPECIES: GIY-YIG nuclease family protein [unclassified Sphingomonas]KQS46805.1 endonuclease [Sphingomonas sp. Leaf198]
MDRQPAVYILASWRNGTLYIGVTSNLMARIVQHRAGSFGGFTRMYGVKRLVWFEMADTMEWAIAREKQLKNWHRAWKIELIEADNPTWRDLAEDWGFDPLPQPSSRA